MIYKEMDIIYAEKNLSELVLKGCRGVILLIYDNPALAYEVEFVDSDNQTLEILTVKPCEIIA